jgi:hypothetical protein
MSSEDVTLDKIAVASLLFDSLNRYNTSLAKFGEITGGGSDLGAQEHRDPPIY